MYRGELIILFSLTSLFRFLDEVYNVYKDFCGET